MRMAGRYDLTHTDKHLVRVHDRALGNAKSKLCMILYTIQIARVYNRSVMGQPRRNAAHALWGFTYA
jgi:hypothetical protein